MKLSSRSVSGLANMICGDDYSGVFRYRSSSYLTQFFQNVESDRIHNGETRRPWVKSVLDDLNVNGKITSPKLPTIAMIKVIEGLLHPDEYMSAYTDRKQAQEKINNLLAEEGLFVDIETNPSKAILKTIKGDFISTSISERETQRVITFCPTVFKIPSKDLDPQLVSVMMPFDKSFDGVYKAIGEACDLEKLNATRADSIWDNSAIIDDIFSLIYCSSIVIIDLSQKNSNVYYEMGIAHTLGKHVIPLSQTKDNIPFDIQHHRILYYLNNNEGLEKMKRELREKLSNVKIKL